MENREKQEIKKLLEAFSQTLKARGLNVAGATILDSRDFPANVDKGVFEGLRKKEAVKSTNTGNREAVSEFFKKLLELKGEQKGENEGEDNKESSDKCFCPNCYNFDTFEDTLREDGSIFDYTTFTANGRVFDVKYHLSPSYQETVMVQPQQQKGQKALTLEQLQQGLSEAVQARNFEQAQEYLTAISELKKVS